MSESQALTVSRPYVTSHLESSLSIRPVLQEQPVSYDEQRQWQPILHSSNQVVLYNPRSHALSLSTASISNTAALASGVDVARRQRQEESASSAQHTCPYCNQNLPPGFRGGHQHEEELSSDGFGYIDSSEDDESGEGVNTDPAYHSRASDYFRLLAIVNETSSRDVSPVREGGRRNRTHDTRAFPAEKMAEGYFKMFFQEEMKLGMGANGSVFLCQHVLDGNPLGRFAVKKIAVGESHTYLLKILREVRLLERLRHPNIITYHHAWLETSQFSSFGPRVPTLHVLMQWAEGGSLDDYIDARLGRKPTKIHIHPASSIFSSASTSPISTTNGLPDDDNNHERPTTPTARSKGKHTHFADSESIGTAGYHAEIRSGSHQPPEHAPSPSKLEDQQSRAARIKAFRAYQRAPPEEKERMRREMDTLLGGGAGLMSGGPGSSSSSGGPSRQTEWTPVHLLSAQEIRSLFTDVVEGLAFLHDKSILHLDLKPGNVLLTWDEEKLIPRAMLSDFGTSRDMINSSRVQRSGNTGTLEYTAPESLPSPQTGKLQQIDSKADMWSLGMILHKLLFFKLPYRYAAVGDANGEPISRDGESEKMERLEREVLEYPGFKSTPTLVAGFETRRLPRAFLVLLENLLQKYPPGRPSCERVSNAIREGKLDPLSESPSGNLPLTRSAPAVANATVGEMPLANGEENQKMERSILALPSPVEILGPEEGNWRNWFSLNSWMHTIKHIIYRRSNSSKNKVFKATISRQKIDRDKEKRKRRALKLRAVRSSLLVLKVLTIPRICLNAAMHPRPLIAGLLLGAAMADTIVNHQDEEPLVKARLIQQEGQKTSADELGPEMHINQRRTRSLLLRIRKDVWITAGLALVHAGILGLSVLAAADKQRTVRLGMEKDFFSEGVGGITEVNANFGSGFSQLWDRMCCVRLDGSGYAV